MPSRSRKGAILFIVLGVLMVVAFLATVILRIVANQSRLTHHQVTRIQALYADKAGMLLAFEKLRTAVWVQDLNSINYYCINGNVDAGIVCLVTIPDLSIPYDVQIAIYPKSLPGLGNPNLARIEVKTDYTYIP